VRTVLLYLRWSLRDLRARWLQVAALGLVIALGVGTWSGLGGTSRWRRISTQKSLQMLNIHDARITLADGSFVPQGVLNAALHPLLADGSVLRTSERLVTNTQVDASSGAQTVLAPGQLIGVDHRNGPAVDRWSLESGSLPAAGEIALDLHFARDWDLLASGSVTLSGNQQVRYSGHILTPDHFIVVSNRGGFFAGARFAIVYAGLADAQRLSGHPGMVNEVVIDAAEGTDTRVLTKRIEQLMSSALPDTGSTIVAFADEPVYRLLFGDIDSDQRFYNIFAGLILAGAVFGALNLARRMIEAERREIGIALALGVPVRYVLLRPVLVGVEIAVLGAVCGVGFGLFVGSAMRSLLEGFLPLPVWETGIDWSNYARGIGLGVAIPLLGLAWPVLRATRVTPMETMQPLYRVRSRRISALGRHVRLRGGSTARIPMRNVLRSTQRTLLTVLAVAATSSVFFSILGMLDSFTATIHRGGTSSEGATPERVAVDLDAALPLSSPLLASLAALREVQRIDPGLRVPASFLRRNGEVAFDVVLEMRDLVGGLWRPTLHPAPPGDGRVGVVLGRKAADDLGVTIGDVVMLRHPVRTGAASFAYVVSQLEVLALHDVPLRTVVLMDISHAGLLNLRGVTNTLDVLPAVGVDEATVKRAIFPIAGVASVQGVSETVEVYEDLMDRIMGFLVIVEGVTLFLVLLVAFNSTSINVDERRREHATMFAFGLGLRTVIGMLMLENLVIGVVGGALGVGAGAVLLQWMMRVSVPETMPDISLSLDVGLTSVVVSFAAAALAVCVAPLLMLRQLRRLDIPSTLRVVE